MLALFLEFVSYITRNLAEYVTTASDNAIHKRILHIYMLLDRIAHNLDRFAQVLIFWQQHTCEGGAWAGAHECISIIDHILHILGNDLNNLISSQKLEAGINRCKFRGGPALSKFDVFDVWTQIVHRNAVERFCGWVSDHSGNHVRRTIYIPNYSLLLPTFERTSQLSDTSKSQWKQIDFDCLEVIAADLNQRALSFLPELPPEFPINGQEFNRLAKPTYAQIIKVPAQEQEIIEIVARIQNSISSFRVTTNELRDELVGQGKNTPEKLLNAF